MRLILAFLAVQIVSTDALAEVGLEDVAKSVPVATGEPEPLIPERCEFVGISQGVKLWRGDCVSASLIARNKKSRRKNRAVR